MGEGRESVYLTLHCHYQNDFCIRRAVVSAILIFHQIVRGKVSRQCPLTTAFEQDSRSGIERRL